ncbi:MAG: hypothetical protein Rubg2KO_05860 [Rubricoccaceae bacterium]
MVLAIVGLAACASVRPLTWDDLVGTTWAETCPDEQIATAYLRLEPDSSLAWSYEHPDSLALSDVHGWSIDEGRLVVSWNLGGAVSHYPLGTGTALVGSSTFCSDATRLVPTP